MRNFKLGDTVKCLTFKKVGKITEIDLNGDERQRYVVSFAPVGYFSSGSYTYASEDNLLLIKKAKKQPFRRGDRVSVSAPNLQGYGTVVVPKDARGDIKVFMDKEQIAICLYSSELKRLKKKSK